MLIDWLDRYLDAWQKVAADEGCLLPENMEAEYVAFVEQLDFLTGATEEETDHITLRARLLRRYKPQFHLSGAAPGPRPHQ